MRIRLTALEHMRLGKHQVDRLWALSRPGMWLVVGTDKVSQSLKKRGLIAPKNPDDPDAFLGVTPAGLRVMADLLEAGHLEKYTRLEPRKQT